MNKSLLQNLVRFVAMLALCTTIALVTSCSSDDEGTPAPTITSFTPDEAKEGADVTITGTNLGTATKVEFNGTSATITSKAATTLEVKVPTGATSGKIKVTTPGGSATSTADFTVKCAGFDENAVNSTAFINFTTWESAAVGFSKSLETMGGSPSDAITVGEANPDADECSTVGKYVKTANIWDGWNGFKIVFDNTIAKEDFIAFGDYSATPESLPSKKIKVDVYFDGDLPESGFLWLDMNSGNNAKYAYPNGRTQFFRGKITKSKQWETVTLDIKFNGDGTQSTGAIDQGGELEDDAASTDMFEFLPGAGGAGEGENGQLGGGLYYFDNFRVE
jgi:hypothetical protein